jgi:UDP-glucuronate decarboxylase
VWVLGVSKKILVTGGAGFIGSHLCERLLARGDRVLCVDSFLTGSRANVARLMAEPGFELRQLDVTLPFHADVDEIYNLACPASPVHYQRDPIHTTLTSILGAINVLDIARETGAVVLQASTSEVYGDPDVHPQTEAYWGHVNPIGPRACYDEGKRGAETLFFDHHRQHAIGIKVVRLFNTYGPNMHPADGRVVSNFIVQALRGDDITVFGDGSQTRSFCYVDDIVDGLMRMMGTGHTVTGPVNLGNPGEFTIAELAEIVVGLVNSPSRVVYRALPTDDPRQRRPDITRARELLHWEPRVQLVEGLLHTIAYFDHLLSHSPRVPSPVSGIHEVVL